MIIVFCVDHFLYRQGMIIKHFAPFDNKRDKSVTKVKTFIRPMLKNFIGSISFSTFFRTYFMALSALLWKTDIRRTDKIRLGPFSIHPILGSQNKATAV